ATLAMLATRSGSRPRAVTVRTAVPWTGEAEMSCLTSAAVMSGRVPTRLAAARRAKALPETIAEYASGSCLSGSMFGPLDVDGVTRECSSSLEEAWYSFGWLLTRIPVITTRRAVSPAASHLYRQIARAAACHVTTSPPDRGFDRGEMMAGARGGRN